MKTLQQRLQEINTSTSAGRMMLNILMTFAQYEREIIAERVRDKIGAAKKRGKNCGGYPVLGYDTDPVTKKQTLGGLVTHCRIEGNNGFDDGALDLNGVTERNIAIYLPVTGV